MTLNLTSPATLREMDSLQALCAAMEKHNMTPGWIEREQPMMWTEPQSAFIPSHWSYATAKAAMQAAGRLIGTDKAERRNFVMRNPIPDNDTATLRTLICAYQSILPGEKARSHRHAPHALRVILESHGSYSVVDGEKHPMETGDIVLTPGWCWHGHGHEGNEQAYWFDGLDIPLTSLLEPMFYQEHPQAWEPVQHETLRSPMRFSWADTRSALAQASSDSDGHFGKTIVLPAPDMPTMTLKVHQWAVGWRNRPYRHTANTVYLVMQGHGRSIIGENTFDWSFGDTLAVPAWSRVEHQVGADSILFAMSDEQLMRWTRYYRHEALA
ncbi:Gentisate 1,2-dioxygenase [compost metagenome]